MPRVRINHRCCLVFLLFIGVGCVGIILSLLKLSRIPSLSFVLQHEDIKMSRNEVIPRVIPLIVDYARAMHSHCMSRALSRISVPKSEMRSFVSLPFNWNGLFCDGRDDCSSCNEGNIGCQSLPPAAALPCEKEQPPRKIDCGGNSCEVSTSLRENAAQADAIIMYHVFLSHATFALPHQLDRLLRPPERSPKQLWAFVAMWESYAYYPAGADPRVLSEFNLTIGSDRKHLDNFLLSYLPDWDAILRPYSLTNKLAHAVVERRSNVSLVMSNCKSKSGREVFLENIMRLTPVDSFGTCLNNRDPGFFNNSNFDNAMKTKHRLIYGYKFLLAFENSYLYDYVTEKIFDAWESQVVPIYRGAQNIADYAPGPKSFIHVTDDMTPAAIVELLTYLDKNDTAYNEYHAWRAAPRNEIVKFSPLGRALSSQAVGGSHVCVICNALYAQRVKN